MKVIENETVGLKINIQNTKIMASSPITSWQVDGETMATLRDFILGGFKISADAPWKKSYVKPRLCIKNQRNHFADKGPYSQSYGFSSRPI